MCKEKKTLLAENPDGFVLWCADCETFSLHFYTIIMTLNEQGFEQFKASMGNCYNQNKQGDKLRNRRDLIFETQLNGLNLCFSLNDVGSLLSLLQMAGLSYYYKKYFIL